MNNIEFEQKNNRLLYREMFLKAYEGFNKQINDLKVQFFCKSSKVCCKIRYTDLSPAEIQQLKIQGEDISSQYTELFIPYGANEDFCYETNNHIDIEVNHNLARQVNKEYVNFVIAKSPKTVYFYYCKNEDKDNCSSQKSKSLLCSYPNSVTTLLPKECGYRNWQEKALEKIKNEISRDIYNKLQEIEAYRQTFECKRTGTCCKLASSEFSYNELKEKAKNGDNFATQFVSVFIPYENIEEVKKIFPEYIDFVKSKLGDDENIYFYHCPHITVDNLCSIYEKRPQICRDFPNNPLSILPPNCGYCEWKEEVTVAAMLLHALIEISDFHVKKIESALEK